ncbi:hypothetical protein DEAC_c20100 [Desulfosporosinus acididurans]|uniref:Uncharacterized protein n=1 Tax=Desulfosporosinus acididurans TaxID=476652 RepID=A0A0J1IMQ6_9FIRM|nr:hypothetical protein DEAC_c20100 [Desulfosporosinus acididurans]
MKIIGELGENPTPLCLGKIIKCCKVFVCKSGDSRLIIYLEMRAVQESVTLKVSKTCS